MVRAVKFGFGCAWSGAHSAIRICDVGSRGVCFAIVFWRTGGPSSFAGEGIALAGTRNGVGHGNGQHGNQARVQPLVGTRADIAARVLLVAHVEYRVDDRIRPTCGR